MQRNSHSIPLPPQFSPLLALPRDRLDSRSMATCGSLRQIFESPPSEDPLSSWSQIQSLKSVDAASFTDLFGELHFHDDDNNNSESSPPPPPPPPQKMSLQRCLSLDPPPGGFSEKLQLCTEGLGFESSAAIDDDLLDNNNKNNQEGTLCRWNSVPKNYKVINRRCTDPKKKSKFPPPITSIRRSGTLRSYKEAGRFVLREVGAPAMEFMHASREDGRLKLHLVHPNEDAPQEDGGDGDRHGGEDEIDGVFRGHVST